MRREDVGFTLPGGRSYSSCAANDGPVATGPPLPGTGSKRLRLNSVRRATVL